jgi:heterodisulfide reductase subunit A
MATSPDSGDGVRIGVYICHCGTNIAQTVDVNGVVDFAKGLPGVAVAKDHKYMCSDPGQQMIKDDIKEHNLNRVVVCSCSPTLHEGTFRRVCRDAGLNQFLFQMGNIREHCSWVTEDRAEATRKAEHIMQAAVRRVELQEALDTKSVDINPDVLVVGGGIAGIEAALKLADAGKKVFLVERDATIGGHMGLLDKTFPTLDCSACILTPKMSLVGQHPNIVLMTWSEVDQLDGYVGNFKATIRHKARYVDVEKCTGCGLCWNSCPALRVPTARRVMLGDKLVKAVQ